MRCQRERSASDVIRLNTTAPELHPSSFMENARLVFSDIHPELSIRHFRVEEHINDLFSVNITAVAPDESLALGELVGRGASFELNGNRVRRWRGQLSQVQMLRTAEDATGLATYAIQLMPTLWRLSQRRGQRSFQHITIPDIVSRILDAWGIPQRWSVDAALHPKMELRTQFGEDDLSFVRRLLEEAGIAFYIDDDGDTDATVVFDDTPNSRPPRPAPLSFVDRVEQVLAAQVDFATALTLDQRSLPGAFTLVDYDSRRPRVPLFAGDKSERAVEAEHEQYSYAPGRFRAEHDHRSDALDGAGTPVADGLGTARTQQSRGGALASIMRQAADVHRRLVRFDTNVNDLRPGTVLHIAGHPRPDISSTALMVERFVLDGEIGGPEAWHFEASCVFADMPYRPTFQTPRPRIYGLQTAVVVGPGGTKSSPSDSQDEDVALDQHAIEERLLDEEIYVDELGRVRVQFHWDREGHFDCDSSIWMRVGQGWAGAGYGLFTVPRVGHEVLVAFINGEPDSPVIVGSVHNAVEPVPFKLPENKTVSCFRTCSSPGGGGFNEMRFDDAAGREYLYLQAERDMGHLVKRDRSSAVGRNATRAVVNTDVVAIGHDRTKIVNHNEMEVSGLNRSAVVGINRIATVGVEDSTQVGTRWSVTIARGLSGRLTRELDRILEGPFGGVARSAATSMLGRIPFDPLSTVMETALSSFNRIAVSKLKNVIGVLDGFENEPGPAPTGIEMTDRQIKLSTGEASIILDGPNVVITAQGSITMHAHEHVTILAEGEAAIAARDKAAIISANDDVILQAAKDLHLNPFEPSSTDPLTRAEAIIPGGGDPRPQCDVCGTELVDGVCPNNK